MMVNYSTKIIVTDGPDVKIRYFLMDTIRLRNQDWKQCHMRSILVALPIHFLVMSKNKKITTRMCCGKIYYHYWST